MSSDYELEIGGALQGTLSLSQLKQLAMEGALVPNDRVRPVGVTAWQKAEQLSDLWNEPTLVPPVERVPPTSFPDSSRSERSRLLFMTGLTYVLTTALGWCTLSIGRVAHLGPSWSLIVILLPLLLAGQLALMVLLRWHPVCNHHRNDCVSDTLRGNVNCVCGDDGSGCSASKAESAFLDRRRTSQIIPS